MEKDMDFWALHFARLGYWVKFGRSSFIAKTSTVQYCVYDSFGTSKEIHIAEIKRGSRVTDAIPIEKWVI